MVAPKIVKAFRLSEASITGLNALLPKIRKRTGQNCTVSELVRQSIEFAIRHSDELVREIA